MLCSVVIRGLPSLLSFRCIKGFRIVRNGAGILPAEAGERDHSAAPVGAAAASAA